MSQSCDYCDRPASVHVVEISSGAKTVKHLCKYHAAKNGIVGELLLPKNSEVESEQDLEDAKLLQEIAQEFIDKGDVESVFEKDSNVEEVAAAQTLSNSCPTCGMALRDYMKGQQGSNDLRLGCEDCWVTFEAAMASFLERLQSGATHHVGMAPTLDESLRLRMLSRLRRRLEKAVEREQYEVAAKLHSEIKQIEQGGELPEAQDDEEGV